MIQIALIDDKSYGIDQIRNLHIGKEYELEYFETFSAFKKRRKHFDITYLDFYLDKDGITGDTIIDEVKKHSDRVIGFSSLPRCNKILVTLGADDSIEKV